MKQVIERCDICKKIPGDNGFKLNGSVLIQEISGQHTRFKRDHSEVCRTCIDAFSGLYNKLHNELPEVTK